MPKINAYNPAKFSVHMTSPALDHRGSRLNPNWRALVRTRANLLATGPRQVLDVFSTMCRDELRPPVHCAESGPALALESAASVVLMDVDQLDAAAQATLSAWIRSPENVGAQIVSLSTVWLFGLVKSGRFDRDLYYRLNTIYLRLDSLDSGGE